MQNCRNMCAQSVAQLVWSERFVIFLYRQTPTTALVQGIFIDCEVHNV